MEEEDNLNEVHEMFNNTSEEKRSRRELRRKYRDAKNEMIENRENLLSGDGRQLNEKLQELDKLYSNVRNPREAVCDSDLIKLIATFGRQKAQDLPVNLVKFQTHQFTEKLITFMLGDRLAPIEEDNLVSDDGWQRLGAESIKHFKKTPTYHYMFGSFKRGEQQPKERATRVSRKDTDKPAKTTAPQELAEMGKQSNQETTTEEVERVLAILREWYNKNDSAPICYFEFVINPNSIALTTENIFHVSFLVKDGAARIYLDHDRLPVIEPTPKNKKQAGPRQQSHQMIVTLNKKEWQNIIDTFKISRPLIPPRNRNRQT